jgi:protein involved in polysaccharide export with SLBB domain/beta-lactamase regulating signal transducer with metallopeptidase domain
MTAAELALALVRTTLATGIAACLALLLLSSLRVVTPRVHRIAWSLVVLQGWLLIPWTFQIKSPPVEHASPLGGTSSSASTWSDSDSPSIQLPTAETNSRDRSISPAPFAILAWLTGAALAAGLAAARYARILRTLPLGAAPDDPQWQAEWSNALCAMPSSSWACPKGGTPKSARGVVEAGSFAQILHALRRTLGVPLRDPAFRLRVDLRITDRLGPLLAYIPFTYLILAPRPLWTVLTSAERSAILRHELAHLRRRDLWKSLALRALALPQWFNPLAWLAVRRFDEAAEWACDDAATSAHPNEQLTMANSLLHAAEFATATPCGAVAVQGGVLSRRIHRLVTPRFKEESNMRKLAVPALLAALAAAQLIRIDRVSAESAVEQASHHADAPPAPPTAATRREYKESAWPRYIVEPPDILLIEGVKLVPKAPHRLEAFDAILVRVAGAFPEHPIDDTYSVDADGTINLGPTYGRIHVAGLTIEEAEERIRADLSKILTDVKASASLVASAGAQQITGQHLVAMDGRVNLGVYGSVYVAGLTIEESCEAIEKKLAERLEQPQVSVDVLSYNSKVYYVITKGGGKGDNVVRAPITGNETVLDAIANIGGMSVNAATKIWIARPAPNGVGVEQILPVAWNDIADGASTATNYQLMPGDRLFIEPQPPESTHEAAAPAPEQRGSALPARDGALPSTPYSVPTPRPSATQAEPAQPPRPVQESPLPQRAQQILFKISVIRDRTGDVTELSPALRTEGAALGDANALLGALRILRKHELIEEIADPMLATVVGRTARMELAHAPDVSAIAVAVSPRSMESDGGRRVLNIQVGLTHGAVKIDRGMDVPLGQTLVLAAPPHAELGPGKVYLVVTPELVE